MAAPGAPGGAPPAYSFAAKQAPVEWRVGSGFHLDPFLSGRDVSPQDLNALDQVASMLEVARIEPPPGVDGMQQASQLARLATILQLSSEYQGTRAEVRLSHIDSPTQTPMTAPRLRCAPPRVPHARIEVSRTIIRPGVVPEGPAPAGGAPPSNSRWTRRNE